MTKNDARKTEIRAYMNEHPGVRYGEAARLDQQRATTATATAVTDPPAPDDDHRLPPIPPRPDEVWPDPAAPQAAAAALSEVLWLPAAADATCPCPGGCRHGQPCPAPKACAGRLRHLERLPSGDTDTDAGVDVHGWLDVHECTVCGHETENELRRETAPWGELLPHDGDLYPVPFPGVEHPKFGDPRHPNNAVLCTTCGWTVRMACPDCRGCGCYSPTCTGYRHEADRHEFGDDPDACQCGPYGDEGCQCF